MGLWQCSIHLNVFIMFNCWNFNSASNCMWGLTHHKIWHVMNLSSIIDIPLAVVIVNTEWIWAYAALISTVTQCSPVQPPYITIVIYDDIVKYNDSIRFSTNIFVLKWSDIKLRPTLKCYGGIQELPMLDVTGAKQIVFKHCRLCFWARMFPIHFNTVSSLNSFKFNHA